MSIEFATLTPINDIEHLDSEVFKANNQTLFVVHKLKLPDWGKAFEIGEFLGEFSVFPIECEYFAIIRSSTKLMLIQ